MVHEPAAEFMVVVDGATVVVRGEVDLASADALRAAIDLVDDDVTVDLSGVVFMDAAGLRCLLCALEDAGRRSRTLRCVNPHGEVLRLLGITGMFDALGLEDPRCRQWNGQR